MLTSLDIAPETIRCLVDGLPPPAESADRVGGDGVAEATQEASTTSGPDLPFPLGYPRFTPRLKRTLELTPVREDCYPVAVQNGSAQATAPRDALIVSRPD